MYGSDHAGKKKGQKMILSVCFVCSRHTDMETRTHTHKAKPMRYGFAMATALTTTVISGDFPSVYNNHHGNSISLSVGMCTDSGKATVACLSE